MKDNIQAAFELIHRLELHLIKGDEKEETLNDTFVPICHYTIQTH